MKTTLRNHKIFLKYILRLINDSIFSVMTFFFLKFPFLFLNLASYFFYTNLSSFCTLNRFTKLVTKKLLIRKSTKSLLFQCLNVSCFNINWPLSRAGQKYDFIQQDPTWDWISETLMKTWKYSEKKLFVVLFIVLMF